MANGSVVSATSGANVLSPVVLAQQLQAQVLSAYSGSVRFLNHMAVVYQVLRWQALQLEARRPATPSSGRLILCKGTADSVSGSALPSAKKART